ncbi:MAG: aminoacetone oxidase family FAD-binding enzyme [Lachnospiraceae bacterium]|nr:aminoacetone oxidase family FAD-binding enzyme [Lachnospiraceae bacterium]
MEADRSREQNYSAREKSSMKKVYSMEKKPSGEYTVGVIGGGAAGMTAAIAAARQGAAVMLLEGNERLGKKLLSTGNGKCNLGNEKLDLEDYYTDCPELVQHCLSRFGTQETLTFFQGLGLMVSGRNGYLYPMSQQASSVLDVLRYEIRRLGIEVVTDCKVSGVEHADWGGKSRPDNREGSFLVRGEGTGYRFDRVILACGGRAAPKTGSDGSGYRLAGSLGHTVRHVVPALVQLRCREDYFKSVAGVRTQARLQVLHQGRCAAQEQGELQLTEYGISGIPVFQISRVVNYILQEAQEAEIVIDFLPDCPDRAWEALFAGREHLRRGCTVEEYFTGILHKKLMMMLIRMAGLKASGDAEQIPADRLYQVYRLCRQWKVHVIGSNSYDNAQVCAGGIPLNEVTKNLESVKIPGLYFAGEILDVDGKCGGYNLQWAWCSGHIAGTAAAGKIEKGNRHA